MDLPQEGYGSATRIEQVVLLPILGINTAIISIIAQNIGAKYYDILFYFNKIRSNYNVNRRCSYFYKC